MKEIIEKENINIENIIYEVRGVQVMLDSDIAKLYQVETKRVNEAVKNNPEKFLERFSFVLTNEEVENLRSKFSTANISNMSRSNPRAFTEQGLYMLATVLKSSVATKVSIVIMDTFVKMRHYINYHENILPNRFFLIEKKVDENTKRINELFDKFDPKEITKEYLFFKNEFYDAYSVILDIFNTSLEEILIIDNYAGKELLDTIKNIDRKIIIVSENIDETLKKKYEKQYNNVSFVYNDTMHDRFIILDRNILYSCGSSLKDVGKKCFSIHEFRDKKYINDLINEIKV